jgi:hypothetical protein
MISVWPTTIEMKASAALVTHRRRVMEEALDGPAYVKQEKERELNVAGEV